jgi:60 kDa SS-A/Ro ribonucleoprotein
VDALDNAFYAAFDAVEPANKRFMIGVDVSGSMSSLAPSLTNVSCAEVAAALALVTKRTEPDCSIWRFSHVFDSLDISPRMRLDDVLRRTRDQNFGSTNCSLPITHALHHKMPVDCFLIVTDNDVNTGNIHPFKAIEKYREATGIPAKMVVLAITGSHVTIANPDDAGMLDLVGFDTSVPSVLRSFVADAPIAADSEEE